MLYDEAYLHAKAEIMEPIGQVLTLVDTRTAQETAQAADRPRGLSAAAVTMAVLLLGGMAVFAAVTRRAVLRPVAELDTATARIAAGETDVRARVAGVSELNALAQRFNVMAERVRTRTTDLQEAATAAESANTAKSTWSGRRSTSPSAWRPRWSWWPPTPPPRISSCCAASSRAHRTRWSATRHGCGRCC
jgi:methyl-accepting chemotaxis protein